FQFEDKPVFLAGFAGFVLARRAVGGSGEGFVPSPAGSAFGDDHFLPRFGEVAEDVAAFAVVEDGSGRHRDDDVRAIPSGLLGSAAWSAADGPPMFSIDDLGQTVGAGDGADDDAAAMAAVTAVGS